MCGGIFGKLKELLYTEFKCLLEVELITVVALWWNYECYL